VQRATDSSGRELSAAEIWQCFEQTYVNQPGRVGYVEHSLSREGEAQGISITTLESGHQQQRHAIGSGPLEACVRALAEGAEIVHYEERSLGQGSDAQALALVEVAMPGGHSVYGAGVHSNIVTASVLAVISALNRA